MFRRQKHVSVSNRKSPYSDGHIFLTNLTHQSVDIPRHRQNVPLQSRLKNSLCRHSVWNLYVYPGFIWYLYFQFSDFCSLFKRKRLQTEDFLRYTSFLKCAIEFVLICVNHCQVILNIKYSQYKEGISSSDGTPELWSLPGATQTGSFSGTHSGVSNIHTVKFTELSTQQALLYIIH